jgi:hypothetical protein
VHRDLERSLVPGVAHRGAKRRIDGIALGRARQVNDSLCNCELAFGAAESLINLPGIQSELQRTRVGVS